MKKTLTISISGIVFHVEEDGYEKLYSYLEAIMAHFKGFEGKEEVIADIEARIAELLHSKISPGKEVITYDDVEEVIGIMGQPRDFGPEEESGDERQSPAYTAIPRRLFRDGERKMLGGVCGGLGAYFNIDPVWVRIIFLVSVAISGFGLLVYIILWIVVPEARTTAERLRMKGEPVTVSNIEKNFKEEIDGLNERIKGFASKARSTYRHERAEFESRHGNAFREGLGEAGRIVLRVFLIFLGVFILLIGIALSAVYLSILFKFPVIAIMDHSGMQAFPLYSIADRIFASDHDLRTFVTGLMIIFGIPLIMMLWGGIRLIFNIPRVRFLAGIAGFAWVCAFIITLIFGIKVANSFRYPGEFSKESALQVNQSDTLHIISDRHLPEDTNWERSGIFYLPEMRVAIGNGDEIIRGIPLIKFKPGNDSTGRIIIFATSKGAFKNEANENAEKVDYNWQQKQDTLVLSDSFIIPDNIKWRKQDVRVEVLLPVGTTITIDKHLRPYLGYHKFISDEDRMASYYYMSEEGLKAR